MPAQLIGYARTSTLDQEAGLNGQLLALSECDKVFQEQASAVGGRPQLEEALGYLREGDTLVVTRLDRLARSVSHLMEIMQRIRDKKAHLKITELGVDTNTPTGKLIVNLVGALAEFERDIMLERQKEGIAKARADGKYRGRAPTARARADQVHKLKDEGWNVTQIAEKLGISRNSVYRILKA